MKGEVPIPVLANYFRIPQRGGIPVDYPGRDVLLQSRITNISKNGVFIVTRNPLPKGSQFEITFQVPNLGVPITAECVVRWSTEGTADTPDTIRGMGLEFSRMSRKDRKNLERFIRGFLVQMRKAEASMEEASTASEDPTALEDEPVGTGEETSVPVAGSMKPESDREFDTELAKTQQANPGDQAARMAAVGWRKPGDGSYSGTPPSSEHPDQNFSPELAPTEPTPMQDLGLIDEESNHLVVDPLRSDRTDPASLIPIDEMAIPTVNKLPDPDDE